IGVVISTKGEFAFPIPREFLVVVIALAGAIGLGLLWVLDLLFYQRLLDAAYIEAKDLEDRHRWLPQPRKTMRKLLGGKGLRIVLWYYIALIEVMVFIGGVGWIWPFWPLKTGKLLELRTGPLAVLCVIAFLASLGVIIWIMIFMRKKTSTTQAIEDEILAGEAGIRRGPIALVEHVLDIKLRLPGPGDLRVEAGVEAQEARQVDAVVGRRVPCQSEFG